MEFYRELTERADVRELLRRLAHSRDTVGRDHDSESDSTSLDF